MIFAGNRGSLHPASDSATLLYGALKTPIQRSPHPSDSRFFCALRFLPGAWLIQYRFAGNTSRRLYAVFKAPGAHHWVGRQPVDTTRRRL